MKDSAQIITYVCFLPVAFMVVQPVVMQEKYFLYISLLLSSDTLQDNKASIMYIVHYPNSMRYLLQVQIHCTSMFVYCTQ